MRAVALAGPRRGRIALSALAGAGAVLAAIALLGTSGYLISRAAQQPPILTLTVAIVAVRAFAIVRALLRYAERIVSHDLALRALADLRARFFARLAPLVPAGLPGPRRGDLLSRFVADVDTLQDLYLRALAPPLVALVVAVVAGAAALALVPTAAAVLTGAMLVAIVAVPAATAAAGRAAGRRQAPARAALTSELVEALEGGAELAVAGRADDRLDRLRAADARLARLAVRDAVVAGAASASGALVAGAALVGVLAAGVAAADRGALDGVLLATLAFVALAAFEGVAPLPAAAQRLGACARAAARLAEITDAPAPVTDPSAPRPLPATGELVVDGVRARYGAGAPWVLDGACLRLSPGRAVALVGPSGAGKTTLAHLLVRFRDPDGGRVTLGGVDLRAAAQDDVRAAVVLAGQDAHLFTTTVRENVLLARRDAADAELVDALARADLGPWLATLPDGLDTLVGEDGAQVSGGQRQRIALARALLADARFLVVDEPTAHLDPAGARDLMRRLAGAADDGLGVLVITHAREGLDAFDEVLELDDGRLRARSRPRRLA